MTLSARRNLAPIGLLIVLGMAALALARMQPEAIKCCRISFSVSKSPRGVLGAVGFLTVVS